MESRRSRLLTVKSAVLSAEELEVEEEILKEFGSQELQVKCKEHEQPRIPSISPASSIGRNAEGSGTKHQDSVTECWEPHKLMPTSRTASIIHCQWR